MSIQAVSWCLELEDAKLKPPTRLVLVAVCNYADEYGECFPSQKKLGKNTGMTARTVRSHLQALECAGYIARDHRQREDGSRTSDLIRIHMDTSKGKSFPVGYGESKGKDSTIQREDFDNPKGKNEQAKGKLLSPLNEPSLEPSPEPSLEPSPIGDGFSDFWKLYPRKKGKKVAAKAWAKAVKETPAQEIIDGLTRLLPSIATQYRGKGEDYRHNPSTWLNGGYWEDETEVPMSGGDMAMGALYETLRRDADNECEQSGNRAIGDRKSENGLLTGPQS
tara:strand:- start:2053 stop:2886 length:834 start_codon:yes stop_codon:yes gene_type:complete